MLTILFLSKNQYCHLPNYSLPITIPIPPIHKVIASRTWKQYSSK